MFGVGFERLFDCRVIRQRIGKRLEHAADQREVFRLDHRLDCVKRCGAILVIRKECVEVIGCLANRLHLEAQRFTHIKTPYGFI